MEERWIIIPGWDKFQHYHDRNPKWVKEYIDQLDRDEYLLLTFAERGLLENIRLLYARRNQMVRGDTASLTRALTQRVTEKHLQALNHAGYILFSASKPVPINLGTASPEKRRLDKKPLPLKDGPVDNSNGRNHICPHCGVDRKGPQALADHIANVHYDLKPQPTFTPPKAEA